MPRINTYNLDGVISNEDLVIGSSYDGTFNGVPRYTTKNYKLEDLAEFFAGYDFNAGVSLTTLEGEIQSLSLSLDTTNSNLTSLSNRLSTAESNISLNDSDISSLSSSISTNASNISSNLGLIQSLSSNLSAVQSSITTINSDLANKDDWDLAASWGNHADAGYLKSVTITETDPVFVQSPAYLVTSTKISNWDNSYQEAITSITVSETQDGSQKTISLRRRNGDIVSGTINDQFTSTGVITDTNNYVDGGSFNASTGTLTLSRTGLTSIAVTGVNFDSRYLQLTGGSLTGALSVSATGSSTINISTDAGFFGVEMTSASIGTNPSGLYMSTSNNASLYLRDAGGTLRTRINSSTTSEFTYGLNVGGVFTCTGNDIGIEGPSPRIQFTENTVEDWYLLADGGNLSVTQGDASTSRFVFNSDGTMSVRNQIALRNFTSTSNSERFQVEPSDFGTGNPRLYLKKEATSNVYSIGLWDGSSNSGRITHNADLISANEEFSCSSVIFAPSSTIANALNFWGTDGTDGFMPNRSSYLGATLRPSLMLTRHSTGSSNYANTTGLSAIFKGNNIAESFLFDRPNSQSLDLYVGFPLNTSSITWSKLVHTGDSFDFGSTNTLTAKNFILNSDRRLKENIEDIEPRDEVRWRQFEMDGQFRYGVIADEVEEIYPEFVEVGDSGYKSVFYIDVLIAENAKLRNRVSELEKDIEIIKKMLTK